MPAFTATAPGKIILFGEHAVVHGEPAIAAPLHTLKARAVVSPVIDGESGDLVIEAPDISLTSSLPLLETNHPLRAAISQVLGDQPLESVPSCLININSEIPPASGLGSGAAISACLIRAFSAFLGQRLTDEQVSLMAFEVEKIHHGTPSGIDNTVVSHEKAIYYRKGEAIRFIEIPTPFSLLIVNSGKPGNTLKAVQQVQHDWMNDPEKYNQIFNEIGIISTEAAKLIESGSINSLGALMDENHQWLRELGVSCPELDQLVIKVKQGGALGAKLSGGGLGGHIIALIEGSGEEIIEKLELSDPSSAFITTITSSP
jgi:mevalonate kinase